MTNESYEPWDKKCLRLASALSKEKRQEFMDCLAKEHLNLGESYKKTGISFDEANGIMMQQIKNVRYLETTIKE